MARRSAPEVNAGSMADIAFLLLIFFLVTTTIEVDSGIKRKLPPPAPEEQEAPPIKEKNIFQVLVNKNDQLLVEEKPMEVKDLTKAAIEFLDNGGGDTPRTACGYCQGKKDPASSDNPDKAVISLVNDRQASYSMYITVMDQLVKAYTTLRNREAKRLYGVSYEELKAEKDGWPETEKEDNPDYEKLVEKIEKVEELFPGKLSEAEPQKAG